MATPDRGRAALVVFLALLAPCDSLSLVGARRHIAAPATAWARAAREVVHHVAEAGSLLRTTPLLDELTNTEVPTADAERTLLAHVARPRADPSGGRAALPLLILIHEFFGLSESIVAKAQALADELNCVVVAPDCYRGVTTSFIPQAIWMAVTTRQQQVDDDLSDVLRWAASQQTIDTKRVALMGFCWGGGKALRYTTRVKPDAATVVFYGAPITNSAELAGLRAPVCAVYGCDDNQFPQRVVDDFRAALEEAQVEHEVVSYYGVGHAFFDDMGKVEREEMPVIAAWRLSTTFLANYYAGAESFAAKRAFLEFQLEQQAAAANEPAYEEEAEEGEEEGEVD